MKSMPGNLQMPKTVKRVKYVITVIVLLILLLEKQNVFAEELQESNENPKTVLGEENQITEECEQENGTYYTEDELYLATVIHAEVANCSEMEKKRVGNVVINRKEDQTGQFRNTIKEVIYQPGQFPSVGSKLWNEGPTEEDLRIARNLLNGERVLPNNVVWFSKKVMYGEEYYRSEWHVFSGWPKESNEER